VNERASKVCFSMCCEDGYGRVVVEDLSNAVLVD
jgi:hypothetical protein